MNKNSAVWLISIVSVFVLLSVIMAAIAQNSGNSVETDTSVETSAETSDEANLDSAFAGIETDTEADTKSNDTETVTETETTKADTESDTEAETKSDDSAVVAPQITINIGGGYTPDAALVEALENAIRTFDRPVSLFAIDIQSGVSVSHNATVGCHAASVVKAAYAYYVCREIDAGNASLDEILTYTSADTVYGNGIIGKSGVGTEYTLYQVLYHTIVTSDNEGYYMLLRRFGRDNYDKMISSLGCSSPLVGKTRWPNASALDMATIWQKIYEYKDETDNGKLLYELFEQVEYMKFIETALELPGANKAGWNANAFNDTGVVYGENSTYIVAILTEGSYYTAVKNQFYDIIRAVDALMNDAAIK